MKINLKLCLLILTLVFSGQSLKAVPIWNDDLQHLDFEQVASCLKEKKPVPIGDQEYDVCEKRPTLSNSQVQTNPCYKLGSGPSKILSPDDLENLPSPLPSFRVISVEKDPPSEYLTVNFTTTSNPHWNDKVHNPVPMEKRYWNEMYWGEGGITPDPQLYVTFLLKKI